MTFHFVFVHQLAIALFAVWTEDELARHDELYQIEIGIDLTTDE
jgi:hypothetical protein